MLCAFSHDRLRTFDVLNTVMTDTDAFALVSAV
jgi:hypothetical protein